MGEKTSSEVKDETDTPLIRLNTYTNLLHLCLTNTFLVITMPFNIQHLHIIQ